MSEALTTRILRQLLRAPATSDAIAAALDADLAGVQQRVATMRREGRIRQARDGRRLLTAARTGARGPARVAIWAITELGKEVCNGRV